MKNEQKAEKIPHPIEWASETSLPADHSDLTCHLPQNYISRLGISEKVELSRICYVAFALER